MLRAVELVGGTGGLDQLYLFEEVTDPREVFKSASGVQKGCSIFGKKSCHCGLAGLQVRRAAQ